MKAVAVDRFLGNVIPASERSREKTNEGGGREMVLSWKPMEESFIFFLYLVLFISFNVYF